MTAIELYQVEGGPRCAKVREPPEARGLSYGAHTLRPPAKDGRDVGNEQTHLVLGEVGGEN